MSNHQEYGIEHQRYAVHDLYTRDFRGGMLKPATIAAISRETHACTRMFLGKSDTDLSPDGMAELGVRRIDYLAHYELVVGDPNKTQVLMVVAHGGTEVPSFLPRMLHPKHGNMLSNLDNLVERLATGRDAGVMAEIYHLLMAAKSEHIENLRILVFKGNRSIVDCNRAPHRSLLSDSQFREFDPRNYTELTDEETKLFSSLQYWVKVFQERVKQVIEESKESLLVMLFPHTMDDEPYRPPYSLLTDPGLLDDQFAFLSAKQATAFLTAIINIFHRANLVDAVHGSNYSARILLSYYLMQKEKFWLEQRGHQGGRMVHEKAEFFASLRSQRLLSGPGNQGNFALNYPYAPIDTLSELSRIMREAAPGIPILIYELLKTAITKTNNVISPSIRQDLMTAYLNQAKQLRYDDHLAECNNDNITCHMNSTMS